MTYLPLSRICCIIFLMTESLENSPRLLGDVADRFAGPCAKVYESIEIC